jgi:hypothetical protein
MNCSKEMWNCLHLLSFLAGGGVSLIHSAMQTFIVTLIEISVFLQFILSSPLAFAAPLCLALTMGPLWSTFLRGFASLGGGRRPLLHAAAVRNRPF